MHIFAQCPMPAVNPPYPLDQPVVAAIVLAFPAPRVQRQDGYVIQPGEAAMLRRLTRREPDIGHSGHPVDDQPAEIVGRDRIAGQHQC